MQKLTVRAAGLYTYPNQISQVPNGSLVQADNVVIDREGVLEPRRGYNTLPGTLGALSTYRANQIFRFGNNVISHYGPPLAPTTLAFYSPEVTISNILTSGNNIITDVSTITGLYAGQTVSVPVVEQAFTGTITLGSNQITGIVSTRGLYAGQQIGSIGLPVGTTISSISGSGPFTITMSANSTYTKGNAAINASNANILGIPSNTTITIVGTTSITLSAPASQNSRSLNFSPSAVDTGADLINYAINGLLNSQTVEFTTTGTLPAGLNTGVIYYVISATDVSFQVSSTNNGPAVNLTSQGTGTHTLVIRDSLNAYGWINYAGTYLQPDSVTKLRSVESNNNVYFTTSTGIQKLDSLTDTIVPSGAPPGLDGYATLNLATSGFMPTDVEVAYRVVWGYKDANKNLILGVPSQRIIIANTSGLTKDVDLNITIPQGVTVNYFYQVYRSGFSATANDEPNDEMSLVYEANPTPTDLTNGFVTFTDETPESLRNGAALYTSPSQEGILQANTPPPFAKDVTLFKGSAFYANTKTKQNMNLNILAVSGQFSIFGNTTNVSGDTPTTIRGLSYSVTGDLTAGSNTINNISDISSLYVGQTVSDVTNPSYIPDGSVITQIVNSTTIIISNAATNTSATNTLSIGVSGLSIGQTVTGTGIPGGTTITNIFSPINLNGIQTDGSPIITNLLSTLGLDIGQPVTGPGIPANTVIQSIDSGTQVTLSKNVSLQITGTLHAGLNTITGVSDTSFLVVNQTLTDLTNPTYIPSGSVITNITGTTVTISNNATNTSTDTLLAASTVPSFQITGNLVNGSSTLSNIVNSSGSLLSPGQFIFDNATSSLIPSGTTITSIIDSTDVILSNAATGTAAVESLTIAPFLPPLAFGAGIQISNPATSTGTITLTLQNGTGGIQIGDTLTIAGTTYTASQVENVATKHFRVFALGSPAQNIADTSNSLIRVINRTTSPTPTIYGFYESGFQQLPGQMLFQERIFGGGIFYATAGTSGQGTAYSPNLPGPGGTSVSSQNDEFANGLYFSKTQQPEAVPLLNFIKVGSAQAAILRVIPLRDSLFILKQDGVYRLTGNDPTSFSVDLFDSTTIILSAESAVSLNNLIFMLSKYGIVTVSDTGVTVISRAIEDKMLDLLEANIVSAQNLSFGISYESDRKYIFFCINNSNDQTATQAYVYNTFTTTWTRWNLSQTCGIVHPSLDILYLGDTSSNTFDEERKTRTFTDYTDSSFQINLQGVTGVTSSGLPTITGIADTTVFNVGQSISGIGIPVNSQIIAITSGSSITINNNATSSGTTTILLDAGKTVWLDSLTNIVVGDALWQTNGRYSIITAVNSLNQTVTVKDFINDWVLGKVTILKAFPTVVKYVPQTAENPGNLKQFREATLLFQVPFFNQVKMGFDTDLSAGTESVLLNGLYGGQWGRFQWGLLPWGGTVKPLPIRTYVPQQKQRCSLMNVTLTHNEAYSFYRLNGISFIHNGYSERVGK